MIFFKESLPFKSPNADIPYHPTPIESSNWNHPGLSSSYLCGFFCFIKINNKKSDRDFLKYPAMHNNFFTAYFLVLCFTL